MNGEPGFPFTGHYPEPMVIAVDIPLTKAHQNLIFEVFKKIVLQYPQHSFLFIFHEPVDPAFIFSKNVITFVVPEQRIFLLQELKTVSILKKHKAVVFVTLQPVRTPVPQVLLALDTISTAALKKVSAIITDSEFSALQISRRQEKNKVAVEVVYKSAKENFKQVSPEVKEKIKEQYAEGNEYFLLNGIADPVQLLNVLKAFSAFKKMQKSNMQLLLRPVGELSADFREKLRLFKYQGDVKILNQVNEEELPAITAAAYAFVFASAKGEYTYPLAAMQSGTPVIVTNTALLLEVCMDAVLYVNAADTADIAAKMTQLYKDEKLRSRQVEKGLELVKKYSWESAAKALWKNIEKAAG